VISFSERGVRGERTAGNRRRGAQSGQSLMEFALIVPVLFLLLLGVAFIAQGFNLQMVLYGAAYEGARVWAKNPPIGSGNYCSPPACNPGLGNAVNFERYVIPVVRQYVTDNGFDGSQVYFFAKDSRGYGNALQLASGNRQLVTVSLLYTIRLPVGNFGERFANLDVTASCTLKRGS